MGEKKYPDYVYERIKLMTRKFNISEDRLLVEFDEFYNTDFVQTDPQFKTIDDRCKYVLEVLWVRYISQPPTEDVTVIPFGITDIRVTPQGAISRIYAITKRKGEAKPSLSVIVNRGPQSTLVDEVQLFYIYPSVKLSRFSSEGNVFFSTSITRFENPQLISEDPLTLLRRIGVVDVKLAEIPSKLSKTIDEEHGYVDEFDLRGICGIVQRYNTGKRPSGSDWAVYTISDDSVDPNTDKVSPSGIIIPSQLTVWIPKRFLKYDVDSKIYCVGTIRVSSSKEPFMNAIYVHPIIAKPLNL
jgi:hypothetical protein